MISEPINTDKDGCCFAIRSSYYKKGFSDISGERKTFRATGVAEFDMSEIKYIGQISSSQNGRVIDPEGISYAVTNGHKDGEPKIIEPIGCAMRGRNPENPSERGRSNGKYKQRIEMGSNISNTITSVQKDSLVTEPNEDTATTLCLNSKVDGKQPSLEHRIYDAEGISTAMTTGFLPSIKESTSYRIRKLTPRECFRLMGVTETDIDKIQQSGISNSQQYKMAGNSIVVDVLYYIFKNMFVPEASNKADNNGQLRLF